MIHKATKLRLLMPLLGFLLWPHSTVACSCVGTATSHCDTTWANGELIFVGTVASKLGGEMPLGNGIVQLTDYEVHFSSVDILRGTTKPDHVITLHTGHGGGDCGYPFVMGRRYLVYAFNFRNRLTTGICTQTAPIEMVTATVLELTKLRDQGGSDRLFGNVGIAPNGTSFEAALTSRPLSNVAIQATDQKNRRFSALTDEQGTYTFASIPFGRYAVDENFPPGLQNPKAQIVEVRYTKDQIGCRVDSFPRPDGRISGSVTDASGAGVAGYVTVEPSDPQEVLQARQRGGLPSDDTNDGRFSLTLLPPGTYRIMFHPKKGNRIDFQQTFAWPPLDRPGLSLGLGQHLDEIKFNVFN